MKIKILKKRLNVSVHSLIQDVVELGPSIHLSVCPLVYPSVQQTAGNHIVEIAKSIEKSSEINCKSIVQFNGKKKHPFYKKNNEKKIAMKSRIVARTNLLGSGGVP